MTTLIAAVIGAILAFGFSFYLYSHQKRVEAGGSATILYHDINHSITSIEITLKDVPPGQVIENRHSNILMDNEFRRIIVDLRNEIDSKHIKSLLTYYHNLEQLENSRVNFWFAGNQGETDRAYEKYQMFFKAVYKQPNEKMFSDAFEEVKNLSAFKSDN